MDMPSKNQRRGGLSIPGQVHHITLTTAGRRPLFEDFSHARLVIAEMRRLQEQNIVHSLAWVLMPDHLHWLLQLRGPIGLANAIKVFKGRSARRLGVVLETGGAVWQAGFRDHALRRESDLIQVARDIVARPLRAGLVKRIGDYPSWDAQWL
jgi:REP element-mobilizing transposase RayT